MWAKKTILLNCKRLLARPAIDMMTTLAEDDLGEKSNVEINDKNSWELWTSNNELSKSEDRKTKDDHDTFQT